MIDLPSALSGNAFDALFERGIVIRTLVQLNDGSTDYKRLLIANVDCTDPSKDILHFFCTSKTDFYERNKWVKNDCLLVPLGNGGDAFDKPMAINLREPYTIRKSELRRRYQDGELQFLGALPPAIIQAMDEKIFGSKLLTPEQKSLILPPD